MAVGTGISWVDDEMIVDIIEFIGSTSPTPQVQLSTPATTGATIDFNISDTTVPLMIRAGPILKPPILTLHKLVTCAPRYIFAPYFYIIDAMRIMHHLLVEGGCVPWCNGFLLWCFFFYRSWYSCSTIKSWIKLFTIVFCFVLFAFLFN